MPWPRTSLPLTSESRRTRRSGSSSVSYDVTSCQSTLLIALSSTSVFVHCQPLVILDHLRSHILICNHAHDTHGNPVRIAENPTLSANERSKALSTILPSSSSPILLNLLTVLSENGRLASAEKVFADFNSLIAAYRGELEVIVTSAEPLDSKSLSRIEKALKGTQAAEGKTLRVTNRVSLVCGSSVFDGERTRGMGGRVLAWKWDHWGEPLPPDHNTDTR